MIQLGVLDPRNDPCLLLLWQFNWFFWRSSTHLDSSLLKFWRATPCYEHLHGQRHAKPVHAKHRLIVALQGMRSTWVLLQTI